MPLVKGKTTSLSKNILQMKFMRKSVVQREIDLNEQEGRQVIDDEHWVLDVPRQKPPESRIVFEPSIAVCQNLPFGRLSFRGFNPEIERLMAERKAAEKDKRSEAREKKNSVDDDEMANRYKNLVGTIGKKFKKKRVRAKEVEASDEGDISETGAPAKVKKRKKGKPKFLKPSEDD